jgi:ribosomal protein S12 methylthiotransferase accessory factor
MPGDPGALAVSRHVGIITYLTEVEQDRGAPEVFVAAARGPDMSVMGYPTSSQPHGSGAGLTWDDACGAAIGECLERYSAGVVDPADSLIISPYEAVVGSGYEAHDPRSWALFDPSQKVPYPQFTADRTIVWVQGWDLRTGGSILLPACFAYLSSSPLLEEADAAVIAPSVSTGCACAASLDEAVFKGLCELIERDAFMIVWRNSIGVPQVLIDVKSPIYNIFQTRFVRPRLVYRIYYTTMDMGMPSFFGTLTDHRGDQPRIVVGGASHPNADRAVLKTLCELVQGLTWVEHIGKPSEEVPDDFADVRTFTDRAVLYAFHPPIGALSFLDDGSEPLVLSESRPLRRV